METKEEDSSVHLAKENPDNYELITVEELQSDQPPIEETNTI